MGLRRAFILVPLLLCWETGCRDGRESRSRPADARPAPVISAAPATRPVVDPPARPKPATAAEGPAGGRSQTQPDGPTFRVVTLNCLWCKRASVEKVAEAIGRHRPDVVFLQEVHDNQADSIAKALKMHRTRAMGLVRPGGEGLDTAVLCRAPLRDVRVLRSPHRVFGVAGESELAGSPVHLICVHQVSTWPAPVKVMVATVQMRMEETTLLLKEVAGLTGPIVIGGDFNEGYKSVSLGRLSERFDHAFDQAGRPGDAGVTFPGFAGGIRIDHVFFTRRLKAVDCFVDPAEVSDHRMVVATLRFADKEPPDE